MTKRMTLGNLRGLLFCSSIYSIDQDQGRKEVPDGELDPRNLGCLPVTSGPFEVTAVFIGL